MNSFRTNYGFVLKNIKKNKKLMQSQKNIEGKTFVIAGGTRGIGFSIAEHLLKRGANVAILGKTKDPHPKLENTIEKLMEQQGNNYHSLQKELIQPMQLIPQQSMYVY